MSIRQIGEQDIADCVEVIRVSFMTIAKQFNITPENATAFTAFNTLRCIKVKKSWKNSAKFLT